MGVYVLALSRGWRVEGLCDGEKWWVAWIMDDREKKDALGTRDLIGWSGLQR